MRASLRTGRQEVIATLQKVLKLYTKKEAEQIFDAVIACIEATLLENLGADGFTIS